MGVNRFRRSKPPTPDPIDRLERVLTIVASGIAGRLDSTEREITALRTDLASVGARLDALPALLDAATARAAIELVSDSHRQIGVLQQQLAALDRPEAVIQLAGDLIARGAAEHLSNHHQEVPDHV